MSSKILKSISPSLREALETIGINTDAQLAHLGPAVIWEDLIKSWDFFPEKRIELSPTELENICIEALMSQRDEEETEQQANSPEPQASSSAIRAQRTGTPDASLQRNEDLEVTRQLPIFTPLSRSGNKKKEQEADHQLEEPEQDSYEIDHGTIEDMELTTDIFDIHAEARESKKTNFYDKSHSIRCMRPVATYLAAWATLFAVIAFIPLLFAPLILLFFDLPGLNIPVVLGILGAMLIPYLYLCAKSPCSVCNIKGFSFRNYPRSRYAHHIVFLGYTIATALHIICFLWYRCPACGTPQRLIK